jgi:hypothetical protein
VSTDVILAWWGKYWTGAVKILGIVAISSVAYAKVPTKADIRDQIQGPDNPYTHDQPLIMRIVDRYDSDLEGISEGLTQIRIQLGVIQAQTKKDATCDADSP